MLSWARDLRLLCEHDIPIIVTQANDYSDLRGETRLLTEVIRARYVLIPSRNPFAAATCVHEEERSQTTWSCANSYFYAVQGVVDRRESAGEEKDRDDRWDTESVRNRVSALAKSLRETEAEAGRFSAGPRGEFNPPSALNALVQIPASSYRPCVLWSGEGLQKAGEMEIATCTLGGPEGSGRRSDEESQHAGEMTNERSLAAKKEITTREALSASSSSTSYPPPPSLFSLSSPSPMNSSKPPSQMTSQVVERFAASEEFFELD